MNFSLQRFIIVIIIIIIRDRASKTGRSLLKLLRLLLLFIIYLFLLLLFWETLHYLNIYIRLFLFGKVVRPGEKLYILCAMFMSHTSWLTC